MTTITVRVTNFRMLERLQWRPEGVCLLVGANGTGKTTTLDVFQFLRNLFEWGHESAFASVDGGYFRRLGAPEEQPVAFEVEIDDIVWRLHFPMSNMGLKGQYGEELLRGGQMVLRAGVFDEGWYLGTQRMPLDEKRCCAKVLWDRGESNWMEPLVSALAGIRIYASFWLNQVRRPAPGGAPASFLHGTGKNLWSVLATWKGSSIRYRGQFEWVMSQARRAFPDVMETLEFDRGQPYLFRPGATDPADGLPPNRAADGLLTGLLQLTAIAGAKSGSIIAFDEMENQLHPHAIRSILAAMRDQADERDLTIVLTTHSPVVLNQFRDDPEQVFVLGQNGEGAEGPPNPASMTDLHNEAWLAQARLGTLYERLAFGAPRNPGVDRES
jgi:predicted ATPase